MMAAQSLNQAVPLAELIAVDAVEFAAIKVSGLALDSRVVAAGDLFLACKGFEFDGRDLIAQAVERGAVAVLAEKDDVHNENTWITAVPVVVIEKLTSHLSFIAGRFYGEPSQQLSLIGVTGTNGKTSCTQLMAQLLNQLRQRCAVIGTLGAGVDGDLDVV